MPSAYMLVTATHEGRTYVLVGKKFPGMPNNGGQHVLPGGRVNNGEELTDAASREFKEETGIYYDRHNKRFEIASNSSCNAWYASTMSSRTHGVLFVDVRYADLVQIRDAAASNIQNRHVEDAELQSIYIMRKEYASQLIKDEDEKRGCKSNCVTTHYSIPSLPE